MRLWGRATSSNVQKVMWALGELGLEAERVDVGHSFGGLDTPGFGRLNPLRRIPVLEDGDLTLFESHAIVRHLAARHGAPLLPATPEATAIADQWMEVGGSALGPPLIGAFYQTVRLPRAKRSAEALARHLAALDSVTAVLDDRLAEAPWLGGGAFSMADIPAGTLMYRYHSMEIPRPDRPNLARWYGALAARPAYRSSAMTSYAPLRADG